jgi:hypothetical protein
MSLVFLSSVLLAVIPPITVEAPRDEPQPVLGHEELMEDRPADAIVVLFGPRPDDPARLINLGAAYARLGQTEKAEKLFKAAAHSEARTDLLLGDGQVMDSRTAAKLALKGMRQPRFAAR